MGKIHKYVTSPLASLVILVLGAQFFQTFITVALDNANYTETAIGLVHAATYLGLLISSLYSELIIRRIGHIRAFTLFSCVMTATILIQAFTIHIYVWMIARLCSGMALAGLYVIIESWLLAESSVEDRGKKLAIYMVALYSSQALSPQIFYLVDSVSIEPYLIAAMLCVLSNIPLSLTYKPSPQLPEFAKLKIMEVFKVSPYGFAGCLASGLILSALYSFVPKFALEYNFSLPMMMSSLICGGFLLQWPLGKLSDRFNREKVLILLTVISAAFCLALILAIGNSICYLLAFLIGGTTFALYPISIALVCDLIKNRCIVQVTGVLLFAYSAGAVLGPLFASSSIDALNSSLALFGYIAIVLLSYSSIGVYKWIHNNIRVTPASISVDCIPLPKQTQVAIQLDPRLDLAGMDGDLQTAIEETAVISEPLAMEPLVSANNVENIDNIKNVVPDKLAPKNNELA